MYDIKPLYEVFLGQNNSDTECIGRDVFCVKRGEGRKERKRRSIRIKTKFKEYKRIGRNRKQRFKTECHSGQLKVNL